MSDNFLKIVKVQNSDGTYSDAINIVTDGDYVTCYNGRDLNTNLRTLFSAEGSSMTNTSDIKDNVITFTSADASSPSNFLSVDVFTTGSKSSVLFNNISKMSSNIRFLNNNKLDKTGDAKSNVVTFISDDTQSPSNFLSMNVLSSGSTIASLFNSMSKMASNIRFLNNNRVDNRYITKSNDGILVHDLPSNNSNGIKIFTDGSVNIANSITSNKDLNLILPVGDSSGSIKLVIDGTSNDGILTSCRIKNTLQDGALLLNNTGAFGLYSYTNSKWILYMNPNGQIYGPDIFSSSLKTTGAIGTGGKTAFNDTEHDGVWLTTDGKIHLTAGATSGGGIGFHYNRSANVTVALNELVQGTIVCNGAFGTGGRTAWNDTVNTGCLLTGGGEIHLSQGNTRGGTIAFHFGLSQSVTSGIYESAAGVIRCTATDFRCDGNINFLDYTGTLRRPIASAVSDGGRVGWIQTLKDSNNHPVLRVSGQYGTAGTTYNTYDFVSTQTISDIRLKKNIKSCEVNSALDIINKIQLHSFDWLSTNNHQKIGFIADELEKIDPKLSMGGETEKDGTINYKSVDTFYLLGYLTKAIQELSQKVEELQQER